MLAGVMVLSIALIAGACSDDSDTEAGQLPDAAALLREATTATAEITSAHFTLAVNGDAAGLPVRNLDGDLTREGGPSGAAKGTGKMRVAGQLVEVEFVLTGGTLYLKGPTGGFQQIPAAFGASLYDPSAVLDPERGVANILRNVAGAKTVAREEVAGTAAYKVTGTVPGEILSRLLPGTDTGASSEITFWLATEGRHLPLKAIVTVPGGQGGTIEVTLSDVDKPVTVTPPT